MTLNAMSPRSTTVEDPSRAAPIGRALSLVPEAVYEAIDRGEPEWPVLERLVPLGPVGSLTGIALAVSDFQLGAGGATAYWQAAAALLDDVDIETPDEVRAFLRLLLKHPVASRLRDRKLARINRLLASGVPALLGAWTMVDLGQQPVVLWHEIATGMRQFPYDKTIAFAMKVFDLMHRIATDRYATFPANVPIVADLRIARVSLSSGLLRPADGTPVHRAMARVSGAAGPEQELIRGAWAKVAEAAAGLSLFRVDSLIWQIAEPVYRLRHERLAAASEIGSILEGYAAAHPASREVAMQLTETL